MILVFRKQTGFGDDAHQTSYRQYLLPNVEIKDQCYERCTKNLFDQPVNYIISTFGNIWKTATDQEDDYTTGCLLDYVCFKNYYKMIVIDWGKQPALDIDPTEIQQSDFTENLDRAGNKTMFFIIEGAKKTFRCFTMNGEIIMNLLYLIWYQHKMAQYNTLNVKLCNWQLNE